MVWRFATSNKVLMTKPNIKFTIGDKKKSNRNDMGMFVLLVDGG